MVDSEGSNGHSRAILCHFYDILRVECDILGPSTALSVTNAATEDLFLKLQTTDVLRLPFGNLLVAGGAS